MDAKKRKELINEWKNRHPDMGVISFKCKATGEVFLDISKDMKADYNSIRFKLSLGGHPNKHLQSLWTQYGEDSFEYAILKVLKYDDPQKDYTDKLLALRSECLSAETYALLIGK